MPTKAQNGLRNSLQIMCWLPTISLVAVEFYVRNFEGWGAWATAPLFLLPLVLSAVIAFAGILQIFFEFRAGAVRTSTAVAIAVALLPCLWLLVRRHVM